MTLKNVKFNIHEAIGLLRSLVTSTLGPMARHAIIHKKNSTQFVDDGATILKEVNVESKIDEPIFQLVKQASLKTDKLVGDGTTTTILLICSLLEESFYFVTAGVQPIFLVKGLKKTANYLVQKIRYFSFPITSQQQIVNLLTNTLGPTLTDFKNALYSAIVKKGKTRVIELEEHYAEQINSTVEVFEGLQFDKGLVSSYFLKNPEESSITLTNPYLLITDLELTSLTLIQEILEVVRERNATLCLIAENFDQQLISTLVINNLNENLNVIPIRAPYFGLKKTKILQDLAIATTATFISQDTYPKDYVFQLSDLGRAKTMSVSLAASTVMLLPTAKINVQRRISELQREILVNDSVYEKDILKQRITFLSSGIVKVNLYAPTATELSSLKYKVQDSINSLSTSFQEGVVISSSSLFVHLSELVQNWSMLNLYGDEIFALTILKKSFLFPFYQLCLNSNDSYPLLSAAILQKGYPFGFDFSKKEIVNFKEYSLLDSAKMLRVIVQNSISSTLSLLLTF